MLDVNNVYHSVNAFHANKIFYTKIIDVFLTVLQEIMEMVINAKIVELAALIVISQDNVYTVILDYN